MPVDQFRIKTVVSWLLFTVLYHGSISLGKYNQQIANDHRTKISCDTRSI